MSADWEGSNVWRDFHPHAFSVTRPFDAASGRASAFTIKQQSLGDGGLDHAQAPTPDIYRGILLCKQTWHSSIVLSAIENIAEVRLLKSLGGGFGM